MPWVKGQSGNPAGHSRRGSQLARLLRSSTKDGLELVEFAMSVLRDAGADMKDRLYVLTWCADRGWGKATERVEIASEREGADPHHIATEHLEAGIGPEGTIQ